MTVSTFKHFDAMQQAITSGATSNKALEGSVALDAALLTPNCWEEGDELLPSGD